MTNAASTEKCGLILSVGLNINTSKSQFEAAAKDLEGKVRFVKLDTDQEEEMSNRLAINGLPTLLFLGKYTPPEGEDEDQEAKAVLKGRIEGAIKKENIVDLCDHYFFGGPEPKI